MVHLGLKGFPLFVRGAQLLLDVAVHTLAHLGGIEIASSGSEPAPAPLATALAATATLIIILLGQTLAHA